MCIQPERVPLVHDVGSRGSVKLFGKHPKNYQPEVACLPRTYNDLIACYPEAWKCQYFHVKVNLCAFSAPVLAHKIRRRLLNFPLSNQEGVAMTWTAWSRREILAEVSLNYVQEPSPTF